VRRLVTLVLACSAIALSFSALAAAQRGNPTVALHIDETKKSDRCIPTTAGIEDSADCSLINDTEGTVGSYFVYILVGSQGLNGIGGVDLSINYDPGITMWQWTPCAPLDFTDAQWPTTGSDNTISWGSGDDCSTKELNIAGFFEITAYDPSRMWVAPRTLNQKFSIVDCTLNTTDLTYPEDAGIAGFGPDQAGCNSCTTPCAGVPVAETTWGKLKNFYSDGE
jgi:hypothetical protein